MKEAKRWRQDHKEADAETFFWNDILVSEYLNSKLPEMTFKDWIKELVDFDDNYSFLLEGTQTGEIFDMHDYYMEGLTPHEAMSQEYKNNG